MSKYGDYHGGYGGVASRGNQLLDELVGDVATSYVFTPTEERYNPCDATLSSETEYLGCEIKVREEKYKAYPTLMLEEHKWNTSPQAAQESGCTDWLYVNFVGEEQNEDLCYIYRKGNIDREIANGAEHRLMYNAKDTPYKDGGKAIVPSILLPKSASTIYKKVDGKWRLESKPLSKR